MNLIIIIIKYQLLSINILIFPKFCPQCNQSIFAPRDFIFFKKDGNEVLIEFLL